MPSGGFLGRILGPSLKTDFPIMKNVLKPVAKSVLILLGLTVAASATDAAIQKKIFRLGMTRLIISIEEMDDIIKIVKSLEESDLLIKGISETIKNEAKEQKCGFLRICLGILSAVLLENLLTGKGVKRSYIPGQGVMSAGEGTIRTGESTITAGQDF